MAAATPTWRGYLYSTRATAEQTELLYGTLATSFAVSAALLLIWRHVIAPAVPGYKKASASDRVFLANSFVSLFPALTAPFLALSSMRRLPWHDVALAMVAPPDDECVRAIGISCGYMAYDCIYCMYYKEVRSPLIIGHHVLPVLLWPFAALRHRAVPVVLFFVFTELSNIGQHGRMLLLKLGYERSTAYRYIGTGWVVAFFFIRILPSPYMGYHMLHGNYAAFSPFEFGVTLACTPLPFILNSYWFYLLFTGVVKFLARGKKGS